MTKQIVVPFVTLSLATLLFIGCAERRSCLSVVSSVVNENSLGSLSAGSIVGRMIEADGQESVARTLLLYGPNIPKGMVVTTNLNGEFAFQEVPTGDAWLETEVECKTSYGIPEHERRQCRQAVHVEPHTQVQVIIRLECVEWSISVQ
jgi:hypothetical protein